MPPAGADKWPRKCDGIGTYIADSAASLAKSLTVLGWNPMIRFRPYVTPEDSVTTTLLAVDDSKTMRKVLEITFAGEDFRTVLCESADEALRKLGENPQVALVDAGLENAAGYELC